MRVGAVTPMPWLGPPSAGASLAFVVKVEGGGQANEHEKPQAECDDGDGGEMCEHERTRGVVDFALPTCTGMQARGHLEKLGARAYGGKGRRTDSASESVRWRANVGR